MARPAAVAMTHHVEMDGARVRVAERPLVEQLPPSDPIRLALVRKSPRVRKACARLTSIHAVWLARLRRAALSPEDNAAYLRAVRVRDHAFRRFERAVEEAERRRPLEKRAREAMAAAAGLPFDIHTQEALETLLHRVPMAGDPALWREKGAGARNYLITALRNVRRERRRSRETFLQGEEGQLTAEAERAIAALSEREADREAARAEAREILAGLHARARLTDTMRSTYEAALRGDTVSRSRRQDLVARLRKAAFEV